MGSFCKNHIKFWLESTEDLSLKTLKSDAKFKEKLTCGFNNYMTNLENFHPITQKSKNVILMDYFCPKCLRFELTK